MKKCPRELLRGRNIACFLRQAEKQKHIPPYCHTWQRKKQQKLHKIISSDPRTRWMSPGLTSVYSVIFYDNKAFRTAALKLMKLKKNKKSSVIFCRGHMYAGREICKCLLWATATLDWRRGKKKKNVCPSGARGRGKAPGRANSHEIPDASCQCGDRPRQLPKSRASPHSSKARDGGGGGGDTAKASPNVKWHLLNTRRGECFHASVPGDLCGPSSECQTPSCRLSPPS